MTPLTAMVAKRSEGANSNGHRFRYDTDVRGVIQLRCFEPRAGGFAVLWEAVPSARVPRIPVAHRVYRIHCLQAAALGRVPDGTPIASWFCHYVEGSHNEINAVYGRDLRCWWKTTTAETEITHGRAVWTGNNPSAARQGAALRLNLTTYENPHPDRVVASLDQVSKMTLCPPSLVALTVV